jgi:hypothetical protein
MNNKIKIETKCKTCLGCNQLENASFTEKYRCKDYVKGTEDGYKSRGTAKTNA